MHLTRFTDYSLRTLIFLAVRGEKLVSIAEIAHAYGISEHHLDKVVHHLGQVGLAETVRGRRGGIRLARPPEQIRVGEVVRLAEEHMSLIDCHGDGPCPIAGVCSLEGMLFEGLTAFLSVLDKYTLADVLRGRNAALATRLNIAPTETFPPAKRPAEAADA